MQASGTLPAGIATREQCSEEVDFFHQCPPINIGFGLSNLQIMTGLDSFLVVTTRLETPRFKCNEKRIYIPDQWFGGGTLIRASNHIDLSLLISVNVAFLEYMVTCQEKEWLP